MTMPAIAFVSSPFVGGWSWSGVARQFEDGGCAVVVPPVEAAFAAGPPYYPALADVVAQSSRRYRGIVLVLHSGAGGLLDAIAEAASVGGAVFVDAILPHPGQSWMSTLPAEMRGRLRDKARSGRLPVWDQWFPPGAIAQLIGDAQLHSDFVAKLPSVPVAFADEIAPEQTVARPRRCAYLRLSDGYWPEARAAEQRGWPTAHEQCHHLAMLTDPAQVARALRSLLSRIGIFA